MGKVHLIQDEEVWPVLILCGTDDEIKSLGDGVGWVLPEDVFIAEKRAGISPVSAYGDDFVVCGLADGLLAADLSSYFDGTFRLPCTGSTGKDNERFGC